MSSTSTNKQPLLVDRPLHEFAVLGPNPALQSASNLSSLVSGGLVSLVDCIDNDGAVIDSLSVFTSQANTSQVAVFFCLSTASTIFGVSETNTAPVAATWIPSSVAIGWRINVSLPPLCVPVPSPGGEYPDSEVAKKNTGLYVPSGSVLYVGLSEAIIAPSPATKLNVFAQGGYF